ncbi:ribosomal protein L4/L1e [Parvibaculum lavamentivorans DS-1]|uniref:Large ribosomal subunit protein uL4 n=1 Tax=Parvibaculum lavamentivorans (strain DS-1 / DSM 13023 / NCIMB 13966) TaxID=402881 RepID=RL4_PARL1|nr:50S ribosomal protein L4 [Parvibaculum lavamentivorans]A7HWR2.1 RecName: Full=Large ribosomal subunit protein uL4; AltName: Full=50S ribosomal protein L4 [Parvibaculum lavamentivorans DS-1]ABS64345.1 ribosomal protein L4/L1e [Parvibaculum lavamentivorans DS-1]
MKIDVTTLEAKKAGSVDLTDGVFALEPRGDILHRMVAWQLAKRQAGTHKTKGRSEIALTGKKFVKQKGSGGARHGDRKAPQFRGGGKAFGPVVRSHAFDMPKKVRALALKLALSAKAKSDNLVILDEAKLAEPRTKAAKDAFEKLGLKSVLIIDGAELDANFALAARNLPNVDVLPVQGINVYDILRREKLVLTKAAVESLEARFK